MVSQSLLCYIIKANKALIEDWRVEDDKLIVVFNTTKDKELAEIAIRCLGGSNA